jgi:hypothetical protein
MANATQNHGGPAEASLFSKVAAAAESHRTTEGGHTFIVPDNIALAQTTTHFAVGFVCVWQNRVGFFVAWRACGVTLFCGLSAREVVFGRR